MSIHPGEYVECPFCHRHFTPVTAWPVYTPLPDQRRIRLGLLPSHGPEAGNWTPCDYQDMLIGEVQPPAS